MTVAKGGGVHGLIAASFARLRSGQVSVPTWLLLALTAAIPGLFPVLDGSFGELDRTGPAVLALLVIVVLFTALMLYCFYRLTRELADDQGRSGAFWPWVGWEVLAILPYLILMVALSIWDSEADYFWLDTFSYIALSALTVLLLVHASGRAIDTAGPAISAILSYWRPDYHRLMLAYLLLTAPLVLAGELLEKFALGEWPTTIATSVIVSLAYVVSTLFGTSLTVEAFHWAERGRKA
jgi:hypothetical protein